MDHRRYMMCSSKSPSALEQPSFWPLQLVTWLGALLIHLGLLVVGAQAWRWTTPSPPPAKPWILLPPVASKPALPYQHKKTAPPPLFEKMPSGQIVELPPPTSAQLPPADTKLLAEHNHRAESESLSRHRSLLTPHPANAPQTSQTAQDPSSKRVASAATKSRSVGHRKATTPAHLVPQTTLSSPSSSPAIVNVQPPSDDDAVPVEHLALGQLMPSSATLRSLAAAPSADHIDGVDIGGETFLNAREFKYASFFNRLKHDVGQVWHPQTVLMHHDPQGLRYGNQSRTTVLEVTLSESGALLTANVINSSGLDFLDEEAQAAFTRASPFMHPPRSLVDPTSRTIVFQFGFHLEHSLSPFQSGPRSF